jgi:F0F1-type ATP synthase assembly protein I
MDDGTSRPAPPPGSTPPVDPVGEAAAWTILARLITGPLLYGGLGWLLDKWLGTQFFVAVGIVGGMALSLYVVYVRYGTPQSPPDPPDEGSERAR